MIFKDTDDLSQNENMSQNNSSTENSNYFQGTMYQGGSDPETPHTEKPRKKKAGTGLEIIRPLVKPNATRRRGARARFSAT